MKPVIYVANGCHQCDMVKDFVRESGLEVDIYNVDLQQANPPLDVFVYPALFVNAQLVAYGEDIIDYLKNNAHLNDDNL
jgi:glutaredoxin